MKARSELYSHTAMARSAQQQPGLQFCSAPIVNDVTLQLVQVHVLFRHGDRSPTPLRNATREIVTRWEMRLQEAPHLLPSREYHLQKHPFGQLTKKGAKQAVQFGDWLRHYYISSGCLRMENPSSSIRARSTNFRRTHFTGWFVLEGLLGSSSAAATVPISIREEKDENLYGNEEQCPCFSRIWRAAWNKLMSPELQSDGTFKETRWFSRFQHLKKGLSNYLGLELTSTTRFPWLLAVDIAQCGRSHGDELPYGVTDEQLKEMGELLAEDYVETFHETVVCQLSMGRLMKEIIEELLQSSEQRSLGLPSLLLYSGHDATIVPLSVCLGVPWRGWPPYLSSISIELWRTPNKEEHYVRVLYNKKEVALPVSLATLGDVLNCKDDSHVAKKTLVTLEEFHDLSKLSMVTENEYFKMCTDSAL